MTDNTEALPPLPEPDGGWVMHEGRHHGYSETRPQWVDASPAVNPWKPLFTADQMRDCARAALALRKQVPEGWQLVKSPITEQMHQAAAKVLIRANGLDGTPQRMLDAMLAAAPALTAAPSAQAEPVARAKVRVWWKTGPEGEFLMTPAFNRADEFERMSADGWKPTYDAASPTAQADPQEPACEVCGGSGGLTSHMTGRDHWHPCPRGCKSPAQAEPQEPPRSAPLTDEECDAIYMALSRYARDIDPDYNELPWHDGPAKRKGFDIIRNALRGISTPEEQG
jgi:hypothetical protein